MNKELRRNIILGAFVIVGIFLFIIGIFQVGSKSEMFSKTFTLKTSFSNASGLKAGGNVRFNGVKAGVVKSVILLNDTTVEVVMIIEEGKRHVITKSALASISSDGLMGDKLVDITTGKPGDAVVADDDFIHGKDPFNTDEVIQTLGESNQNVKVITRNLRKLTDELNANNGTIQALYRDSAMATSLKSSFNNINAFSSNAVSISNTIKQMIGDVKGGKGVAGKILTDTASTRQFSELLSQFKSTSDKLNAFSGQLSTAADRMNSGNGTVNKLLTDTALAADLKQSVLNIKNATDGLNQNMEAMKHNFFFSGYFKKKEKEERKEKEKAEKANRK